MNRAILIDRDGTLCEEVDYLAHVAELRLIPGAAQAVRLAREAGFLVILVTNQSGVARGLFGREQVDEIHRSLCNLLAAQGASLDGIYYCPHHPDFGNGDCDCRKPRPGMLRRAADEHHLDLAASYMIGDRLRDVTAGTVAGATPVLVRTGYGEREVGYHSSDPGMRPAFVAADLSAAVEWILKHQASEIR